MRKLHTCLTIGIICSLMSLSQTAVYAQATRTWVSGVGDDANPGSRTAPCKTLAGAYSKTAAGGEISVLDPGGFGGLTITKSITIDGDGTLASVLVSSTSNGITINAGATDVVTIRNVSFIHAGTGNSSGINYISGGQVHVENCTIQNFANAGILANLTAAGSLSVKNTTITSGVSGAFGINVTTTAAMVSASVDNVHIQTDSIGINASTNGVVTVSNSVVSQCASGIRAQYTGVVNAEGCMISNNNTGVQCTDAASIIRLSNVNIFNNTTGVDGTGKVISFGNNRISGNAINANLPLSVLTMQ